MEDSAGSGTPTETTVSLADAAVAAAIARAAVSGRTADRTPTIEQLLAAFGEGEPTPQARARAAAAMRLAGVTVTPPLHSAPLGARLTLAAPGAPRRRAPLVTALLALTAIAIVTGTAFGVSRLLTDNGRRADQQLPATTPLTIAGQTTATTATTGTTVAAATDTATTGAQTGTTTDSSTTTPTTTTPSASEKAAARRRAERRRAAALARKPMVVSLDASARPTFLCVDDGAGGELFNGTLSGSRTFRGLHIRLNIGLASTRVTVNGKELALPGSPAGFDISRRGGVRPLALGQRPCA